MIPAKNHLIELLPASDRVRLLGRCELVPLQVSEVLDECGYHSGYAYFPAHAFITLLTQVDTHTGMKVGMVGREGMLGVHLSLGVSLAAVRAVVQGAGSAWRIGAEAFKRELALSVPLQRILHRYAHVSLTQLASSAACLRFHLICPRLARCLLMSQDRACSNTFHVTHELLASMLGVRRVGITMAAGALQRAGLIQYHRGELTVLDRTGLEAAACSCYASDQRAYAALLV